MRRLPVSSRDFSLRAYDAVELLAVDNMGSGLPSRSIRQTWVATRVVQMTAKSFTALLGVAALWLSAATAAAESGSSASSTARAALRYEDIAGRWCTAAGRITVSRDLFKVEIKASNKTFDFKLERFEFNSNSITLHWLDSSGKPQYTVYSRFSEDNQSMVQLKTKEAEERPHTRC